MGLVFVLNEFIDRRDKVFGKMLYYNEIIRKIKVKVYFIFSLKEKIYFFWED